MDEYEGEMEEGFKEQVEVKPDPVGEYLGGRNELDERHGKGWAILPNGDQYDGEYRRGKRHGRGLYVFVDGSRYLGNYRCGIRSGQGKFIYPDGTVYEGNWKRNQKHGQGIYTYANGDTYNGAWYKGKRHGVGIYSWTDQGISFEGTWKDGVRVGPCVVHYPKFKFHGYWDYKYPQGPGVFTFGDKHILTGYYKSDHLFTKAKSRSFEEAGEVDIEGKHMNDEEEIEEETEFEVKPSKWVSQNMYPFDYSLLPQNPVALPVSDSEESTCDLDSVDLILSPMLLEAKQPTFVEMQEEEIKQEEVCEEGESESDNDCDFDLVKSAE